MNDYLQMAGIAIVLFCLIMGFYSIQTKLTSNLKYIARIVWYMVLALIVSRVIW